MYCHCIMCCRPRIIHWTWIWHFTEYSFILHKPQLPEETCWCLLWRRRSQSFCIGKAHTTVSLLMKQSRLAVYYWIVVGFYNILMMGVFQCRHLLWKHIYSIYIINRKCSSVCSSVRMGSGPLITNSWKEMEPRLLHHNVDTSLCKVNNKGWTFSDMIEAA